MPFNLFIIILKVNLATNYTNEALLLLKLKT
jgi:hypothetical protein